MIHVNNLEFTYPKKTAPSVDSISFSIQQGEIFGFLGPSGAGKSTTQKILTGLLSNYKGKISVLNKNLKSWKHDYYEHIGVGFELPNHYPKLSALENLNFFAGFYQRNLIPPDELLEKVGLLRDRNKAVSDFSKGMKMRLNFVRSIMHNPEVLFFDEPTSGLDPANARNIKDIIMEQKQQGKTIFITTHNMHVAEELCDRVAFLVNGKIKICDTPRQLRLKGTKKIIRIEFFENGNIKTKNFDMQNIGKNKDFLQILNSEKLLSVHSQETSLEDIFMQVTGHQLYN